MARKKRLIIPVFMPFGGCPNQCVFCDQKGITGEGALPGLDEVAATIEAYLSSWKGNGKKEVAFYGGSFTGLPEDVQLKYLECAAGFVRAARIDGIRVSTRPDLVSKKTIGTLKAYGVDTVELGAQSMSDEVLRLSARGHSAADTVTASRLIKDAKMDLGLQFMPGLPGDTAESAVKTARDIIALAPDFVRVYPALVLKGTALHGLYLEGSYSAWTLEEMVPVCRDIMALFRRAGIPVARVGLQPTDGLLKNIVDGPFHPSFRQLVDAGEGLPAGS